MKFIIKKAINKDLESIIKYLPTIPGRHEWRLEKQRSGEGVYLIAWDGDTPVGCILLDCGGFEESRIQNSQKTVPDINVLQVSEKYRNLGIGTQLLCEVINIAQSSGYDKIGVLVGINNQTARKLYMKHGFEESLTGNYEGTNKLYENGRLNNEHETATYLLKTLS